jgi:hypothetical protein
MKIKRTSLLSGITREREINITEQQLDQLKRIRNVKWLCPQLSDVDRDFLLTGNLPEDWEAEQRRTQ